ncbi:MAG: FHA domain-containing protein [Leifsonia sp.]
MARAHVAIGGSGDLWQFVIGARCVVALPAGADPAVVQDLLSASAGRPAIEDLVAIIPLGGASLVESFAVLVAGDPTDGDGVPVSGVVRGDIAADIYSVGGSRRFADRGIRPWLLADFRSVTGVVVQTDGAPVPRPTEIGLGPASAPGLHAGQRLDWLPVEEAAAAGPVTPTPAPRLFQPADAAAPSVDDTIIRPRRVDVDTVIRPRRMDVDTVILRRSPADPAAAAPVAPPAASPVAPAPAPQATPVPAPVPLPPAPAAPVPPPPDAEKPYVHDDGGRSTDGTDAPEPAVETTRYSFRIGRGPALDLDAVYLIGRKPRMVRVPTPGEDVRLIAVPSPTLEVSSTHVEIRQRGDVVVITDLRSTNGTVVVPPRAGRIRLRPGESLVVAPGTMVHIGDGTIISISVTEPHRESPPLPPTTRRPMT